MFHFRTGGKSDHHTVIHHNRMSFVGPYRIKITDLDMGAEADHFITYLTLKTNHYGYGNDHHRQADSNANHGNQDSRTGNLFPPVRITINPTGKKIGKPHLALLFGKGNGVALTM